MGGGGFIFLPHPPILPEEPSFRIGMAEGGVVQRLVGASRDLA